MAAWGSSCTGLSKLLLLVLLHVSSARAGTPKKTPAATTTEFADVVLVGGDTGFFCSGVVVAPRLVLTAAHCSLSTRIGIGESLPDVDVVRVAHVTVHPTEDLAIMTLERDVGVRVHSIRLDDHVEPLSDIAIVGFGVDDPVRLSGFGTMRVRRTTAEGWGCNGNRAHALGCDPHSELLLSGTRDNDTCFGDSGGGAFERAGKKWRLVGITSRSTAPRRAVCGEGGIYVRTDAVRDWLKQQGVIQ